MTERAGLMSNDIDVRLTEGPSSLRMAIVGALDADAAPRVSQQFEKLVQEGRRDVTLDLGGVTMISSAGVGSLIAGVGEARDEGGRVIVETMSEVVRHVLEMLDLIGYFTEDPQNG